MSHGYSDSKPYDPSNLEDEFLCEYVDGTMDPLVRHVFEEYVRVNPGMEEHIEELRNTRRLLCRYAYRCQAPSDLHRRLRKCIPCDAARPVRPARPSPAIAQGAAKSATMSSYAITVILMLGLALGVSGMESEYGKHSPASTITVSAAQPASFLAYRADMTQRPSYSSVLHPLFRFSRNDAYPWRRARSLVTASIKRELRPQAPSGGAMVAEVVYPR